MPVYNFTFSELLKENQQGGHKHTSPTRLGLKLGSYLASCSVLGQFHPVLCFVDCL